MNEWIDSLSNRDPMYDLVVSYFIILGQLDNLNANGL